MWYRVNEILSLTNKEEWVYCLTGENPADLGSRGALASQQKKPTPALLVDARSEVGVAAVINLSEYSKLHKLVRVVTWVR